MNFRNIGNLPFHSNSGNSFGRSAGNFLFQVDFVSSTALRTMIKSNKRRTLYESAFTYVITRTCKKALGMPTFC